MEALRILSAGNTIIILLLGGILALQVRTALPRAASSEPHHSLIPVAYMHLPRPRLNCRSLPWYL